MGGEAYSGGRWWYTVLFIDNIGSVAEYELR
jgi:hypothetical protein